MHLRQWVGCVLSIPAWAMAQTASNAPSNQQILDIWQNLSGASGQVASQNNGETRLEWSGTASVDIYHHQVREAALAAPGTTSALRSGGFFRGIAQADVRALQSDERTTYLQGAILATDDRSVLSRYQRQITTLQFGQVAPGYQFVGGDIVAQHSTLGASLGLRGVYGALQVGDGVFSAFAGTVADSWEALMKQTPIDGLPARVQRYLRDTWGMKFEQPLSGEWRAFATLQGYDDRDSSVAPNYVGVLPARAHSLTAGAQWQRDNTQVHLELGASRFNETGLSPRHGQAWIIDATHRGDATQWRAGYHLVDAYYASPAQSIAPGLREAYAGVDWQASSAWLLSAEWRDTTRRTAPVYYVPGVGELIPASTLLAAATRSTGTTLSTRAQWTPGEALPGWSFQAQQMSTRGRDVVQQRTVNDTWLLGANYAGTVWNGGLQYSHARLRNGGGSATLANSTDTDGIQLFIGRLWAEAVDDRAPHWNVTTQLFVGAQRQTFTGIAGDVPSYTLGWRLNGEWSQRWKWNLHWQTDWIEPYSGPNLRAHQAQFDATYRPARAWQWQAYARYQQRQAQYIPTGNTVAVNQATTENVVGIQVQYQWE